MSRQSDGMGRSRSPLGGRCRPSRQVQRSAGSERSRLDRLLLDTLKDAAGDEKLVLLPDGQT